MVHRNGNRSLCLTLVAGLWVGPVACSGGTPVGPDGGGGGSTETATFQLKASSAGTGLGAIVFEASGEGANASLLTLSGVSKWTARNGAVSRFVFVGPIEGANLIQIKVNAAPAVPTIVDASTGSAGGFQRLNPGAVRLSWVKVP